MKCLKTHFTNWFGNNRFVYKGPEARPVSEADQAAYKGRLDTDIKAAKDSIENQLGVAGTNVDGAVNKAIGAIDGSRDGVLNSMGTPKDGWSIEDKVALKSLRNTLTQRAEKAKKHISENASNYKLKHEAIIVHGKVKAQCDGKLFKEFNDTKGNYDEVMQYHKDVVAVAPGAKGNLDFNNCKIRMKYCLQIGGDAANLKDRLTVQKDALIDVKQNLGTFAPGITAQIDGLIMGIESVTAPLSKAEIEGKKQHDRIQNELRKGTEAQLNTAIKEESAYLKRSVDLQGQRKLDQQGKRPGKKPVTDAELKSAYGRYQAQQGTVKLWEARAQEVGAVKSKGKVSQKPFRAT